MDNGEQRGGILGSILGRGPRPRSSTHGAPATPQLNMNLETHHPPLPSPTSAVMRTQSPGAPPLPSPGANGSGNRRRGNNPPPPPPPPPTNQSQAGTGPMGQILRRRRSANAVAAAAAHSDVEAAPTPPPPRPSVRARPQSALPPPAAAAPAANTSRPPAGATGGPARRIRLVPHLESNRSLHFEAITRDVRPGDVPLRIGRFTDRNAGAAVTHSNNKLAFRSKVVSRGHAEIWLEDDKFYIRDTKSSSGTFLNHIRLAPPNTESRPFALKDGDILQLGVDYQGGTEEIYRCVKMRVEVGREWQQGANAFNQSALAQLRALANVSSTPSDPPSDSAQKETGTGKLEFKDKPAPKEKVVAPTSTGDCCICLFAVTVCQALFIAPCSHAFHYKCIRPLLTMHHPGFSCPLCRTFADLNADVEIEIEMPPAAPTPPVPAVALPDMEHSGEADTHPLDDLPPDTAIPPTNAVVDLTMEDMEDDVDMGGGHGSRRRSRAMGGIPSPEDTDAEPNMGTSARSHSGFSPGRHSRDRTDDEAMSRSRSRSNIRGAALLDADRTVLAPASPPDGGATLIGSAGMNFEQFMATHGHPVPPLPAAAGAGSSTNPFHSLITAAEIRGNTSGSSIGNSGGRDPDEMDVEEIEAGLVPAGDSDDDAMDDSARGQVPKRRRGAA